MTTAHVLAAIILANLNTKFVDMLKQPIAKAKPEWDLWPFTYVSILTGVAFNWLTKVNLFEDYMANETAGVLITGLAIGAGSWFIYESFIDKGQDTVKVETKTDPNSGAETSVSVTQTVPPEESPTWTR